MPLLGTLFLFIVTVGVLAGRIESWSCDKALYWSFVTATTLGYGDLVPTTKLSRFLALIIALTGMIFTGIVVAIALHAATIGFQLTM